MMMAWRAMAVTVKRAAAVTARLAVVVALVVRLAVVWAADW